MRTRSCFKQTEAFNYSIDKGIKWVSKDVLKYKRMSW